jgi:hypothetical protein
MRITKSLALLAAGVMAVGATGAAAATASADVPGLAVTQIGYNARGADNYWNRNKEYVDITASASVNVKGLRLDDQWAKTHAGDDRACNTFTVTSLPGVEAGADGAVVLPAGHWIRVHSGAGVPSVSDGGKRHNVYMDSKCGWKGHIWGNLGDSAWITLGEDSESATYDFEAGYTVKP